MVASVSYCITFASGSKKTIISQKRRLQLNSCFWNFMFEFVFLEFYVAALCNLGFTICGSYIEQVWPPLAYYIKSYCGTTT